MRRWLCAVTRLACSCLLVMALSTAAWAHAASVYVPVDHWAYPAVERLAALTGTRDEFLGMRPWTREQFARFVERAREARHNPEAERLQQALEAEFSPELQGEHDPLTIESIYTRSTQIAGTPLRDSYHFGQTFADDFGRPYGQGFNTVEGASGYGQYRAAMFYIRGEYQHAASLRAPSPSAIAVLQGKDELTNPSQDLTQGASEQNNGRLLDSYVGASFGRWTATLGKQSLWWSPASGGAMLYSNNIEPIWMARLTNDVPYTIPLLGRVRLDMFYGKLQGHRYLLEPWIHGEKITLQPFRGFEIGFTRTVVFLGQGRGFSFDRLWRSYFSVGDNQSADTVQNDPGDRRGGLDFSWKLPKLPVTLYADSFCDDDPSPLANPSRSAFHPGLYIARLPGALSHMDLRMEGAYTVAMGHDISNGFNYWNGVYRDGYTNKGLLIGDTVGRAGAMWQLASTYWFSARNRVQLGYRNEHISPQFLQGGGTQNDVRASANFLLKPGLEVDLGMQWERVVMPLLYNSGSPNYNVSGWAGVTFWPEHRPAL